MKPKSLILLLSITLIFILLVKYTNSIKINWRFYTINSVGPNNKLYLYDNLIFDEKKLFFNTQDQKTYSIDQESGKINWIFQAQGYSPFPPLVENKQIFLANFDGNVYSLDKKTGYKLWQFNINESYSPDTPIISSLNYEIIFFGSREGILYALDKKTGKQLWKKEFQGIDQNKIFVPNTIHFGSIYTDSEKIYILNAVEKSFSALNQLTGELIWQVKNISFSFDSPLFFDQKIILKQENYILSIDKKTGDYIRFNKKNEKSNVWQVFKIKDDTQHVLVLENTTLSKKDISLQTDKWIIKNCHLLVHTKDKIHEPIVELVKNKIFIQNHLLLENDNPLVALNYDSGVIEWSLSLNSLVTTQLTLTENLILGESNGDLTSIDIDYGKINWKTKSDGQIMQLLENNNQIISINLKSGKKATLYAWSIEGKPIWQYTPDSVTDNKEIYVNQNNVYFLNTYKNLIEKVIIDDKNPNQLKMKNIGFSYKENKKNHDPFLEIKEKIPLNWKIKEKWLQVKYFIKNFKNTSVFKLDVRDENGIIEISIINDEQLYRNKFTDLKIESVFLNEDKSEIKIKGFYYDDSTWKIRFLPKQTGNYQYNIKIKSPYLVKKISGNIKVEKVESQFISIKNNQFTINNEVVFFPIGIQDVFVDHNYNGIVTDEMNDSSSLRPKINIDEYAYVNLENYLDNFKKEANLNIFRYGVENISPTLWQSFNPKEFSMDINGGKFGDQLVRELKKRDFKIIMTIFGFYPPFRTKEEISNKENRRSLTIYLDYVIARFSPYVDLFELSNEAEAHEEWYEFVINYLKENDPNQRPISTNWETNKVQSLDFQSIHWYNKNETEPGFLSREINYLSKKYTNENKAILISEFGFKNYSWFENSSESLRILTWLSIFQNMGIIFWNQGQNGIYKNQDNANIYLGPKEKNYLLSLNNFLPKDMKIPIKTERLVIKDSGTQIYLLSNQDLILGYLLKVNQESIQSFSLNLNLTKNALVQWIDPKTNFIVSEQIVEKNQLNLEVPNFKIDLAVKIKYLK